MQLGRISFAGMVAGILLGGLVTAAACDGTDDSLDSTSGEAELRGSFPFHRRHPGHDAGSVGGAPGGGTAPVGSGGVASPGNPPADGGAAADCDICTQAQACCNAVQGDRGGCSFSAATCASMTGPARPAYVNACLTEIVSVRGAWSGNPPAECR